MEPAAITREELAWARDCLREGDTLEDIAHASGRSLMEWAGMFPQPVHVPCDLPVRRLQLQMRRSKGPYVVWGDDLESLFRLAPSTWARPVSAKVVVSSDAEVWTARFRHDEGRHYRITVKVVRRDVDLVEIISEGFEISYWHRLERDLG